jgi:Arc/MetJ-type ribon-helix-helix transcriptional regulator
MEGRQQHDESIVYEGQVVDSEGGPFMQTQDPEVDKGAGLNNLASSVREVAQKTGEVINKATEQLGKATESIGKAIDSALAARDHVVMVRVNDEALRKIEALAQSGIFKSRSEAAAFLISEGVKSQGELFDRIEQKISEIERLKSELRGIVKEP